MSLFFSLLILPFTGAPKIAVPPSGTIKRVKKGGTAVLQCMVTGISDPIVQWKNPAGKVVDAAKNYRLSINADNELTINPVEMKDEGTWTCEATNPSGYEELVYSIRIIFGRKKSY